MKPELSQNRYDEVRGKILDGYVLMLRRPGVITWGTLGTASHAMIAARRIDDVAEFTAGLVESRETKGVRWVTLKNEIAKYPGLIDVYRPLCPSDVRLRAATIAVRQCGKDYDYAGLLRVAMQRMPLLHWLAGIKPLDPDKLAPWNADKFCSFLAAWCFERAIYELGSKTQWRLVNKAAGDVVPAEIEVNGSCRLYIRGLRP